MNERLALGLLCCALVLGGGFTWWLQLRPPMDVDLSPIETLPPQVDAWSSISVAMDDRVADELAADFNLQRTYRHPTGQLIWLYVGYYSTARGGRPEHTPQGCYTGAGWQLLETHVLDVPDGRVQELLVERAGEHRLVHFWFRSHRRGGLTGGVDLGIDRVVGKLTTGRADGALIRISTPLRSRGEALAARSRLASFRSTLVPQLQDRWPVEQPAARMDSGPRVTMLARTRGDRFEASAPGGAGTGRRGRGRTSKDASPGWSRGSPTAELRAGWERAEAFSVRWGKGSPIELPSGRIRKAE